MAKEEKNNAQLKSGQVDTVDESLKKLDDLKQKVAGGADYTEMNNEFNDIVQNVNSSLSGLFAEIKKGLDDFYEENNSVNRAKSKPCGIMDRQPELSEGEKITAQGVVDDITAEIRDNPIDYANLKEIGARGTPGRGPGSSRGKIILPEIQDEPYWITELETDLNLYKRRGKTKVYYDPIELARGIPAKEREKKLMKQKTLWILLDVSGSMFGYSYKGKSILELLASYIPVIAGAFDGELWQVDEGTANKIIKLEDLRGDDIRNLDVSGGGGTDFNQAFRQLAKKKEQLSEETGGEVDFMTILFTDAEVYWDKSLMPNNLVVVTVKTKESSLPFLDPEKNQKAIVITED